MANTVTVTVDEWLVAQVALAARRMPELSDFEAAIEAIETLRTLREHAQDVAFREGFDLDTPVGPDVAARVLQEATPALRRTLIGVVQ